MWMSSFNLTARHYIKPSTLLNASSRKVQEAFSPDIAQEPLVKGGFALAPADVGMLTDLDVVQALLDKLSKEQIAELLLLCYPLHICMRGFP
jgi:hypothetical protein